MSDAGRTVSTLRSLSAPLPAAVAVLAALTAALVAAGTLDSPADAFPRTKGQIAAAGGLAGEEIWTLDSNGSNRARLTNNTSDDCAPVWSPDG